MKNISELLKIVLVPLHKEGIKFVLLFAFATIFLAMLSSFLGALGLVLTLWCIFFFRDPERFVPEGEGLIVSPADGVVTEVSASSPPDELGLAKDRGWTKVSVFLNVFDVHVNRIPISGKIIKLNYQKGDFLSANLSCASSRNERQSVVLETKNKVQIAFAQVAGMVARRIVCDLKEGQEVKTGERYGIIRFGSRVDIYLSDETKVKAVEGQTMIAGETVIACLISDASNIKVSKKTSVKKKIVKKAAPKKTISSKASVKKKENITKNKNKSS